MRALSIRGMAGVVVGSVMWSIGGLASAIDVKLSAEEAKQALEVGRIPMEKANSPEDVKKVLQQASLTTRVGADPEKDSCGASAILRTKRYRLEAFGRQEAAESKKQKKEVRMPDEFIQKVIDMPNMEVEVQLCGDDEYFAEKADIVFQQKGKIFVLSTSVLPIEAERTKAQDRPIGRALRPGLGMTRLIPTRRPRWW